MTHAGQIDDSAGGAVASCSCGWAAAGGDLTTAEAAMLLAGHYREHPPDVPRDGHMRGPGSPSALVLRRLTTQALERSTRRWGS
jgi:hypothetical protein